jgi:hypothetical protein
MNSAGADPSGTQLKEVPDVAISSNVSAHKQFRLWTAPWGSKCSRTSHEGIGTSVRDVGAQHYVILKRNTFLQSLRAGVAARCFVGCQQEMRHNLVSIRKHSISSDRIRLDDHWTDSWCSKRECRVFMSRMRRVSMMFINY